MFSSLLRYAIATISAPRRAEVSGGYGFLLVRGWTSLLVSSCRCLFTVSFHLPPFFPNPPPTASENDALVGDAAMAVNCKSQSAKPD